MNSPAVAIGLPVRAKRGITQPDVMLAAGTHTPQTSSWTPSPMTFTNATERYGFLGVNLCLRVTYCEYAQYLLCFKKYTKNT